MTDATTRIHEGRGVVSVRGARIEVTSGPCAGRTARVDRPTFVIGKGDAADLRLDDPTISREHLRLTLSESGVRARDEGSKNGTWLGQVRVFDFVLKSDVALELGTTGIRIRVDAQPIALPVSEAESFGGAIGVSLAMRHLFATLSSVAASDVSVLLEGESGVGKEVLARGVHDASPRRDQPFVALDCGAIPASLIESELFGHERGAFTGATDARVGVFEQANGGTLFLDEIGELPLDLQPKLLRALESREVRPVGGRGVRRVDVRIVAATNRRLQEAAEKSEFRRDLFYRLAVARVVVPSLRDRPEDVVPIATRLLRTALGDADARLPDDLAALLEAYPWPGNVRELRNVIDRYARLGMRDVQDLFDAGVQPEPAVWLLPYHEARRVVLDRFERTYFPKVIERAGGVIARAAELAEVGRPSFYRMLDRLRIKRPREPGA